MGAVLLLLLLMLLRLVVPLMLAVNGLLFPLLQVDNKSSVTVVFKLELTRIIKKNYVALTRWVMEIRQ